MASGFGSILMLVGIASAFVATFIYLVSVYRLERYIENTHGSTWESLGEPHLIFNNSLRNNFRLLKFLKRKEYQNLSDDQLTIRCTRIRNVFIVVGVCWGIAFIGSIFIWLPLLK